MAYCEKIKNHNYQHLHEKYKTDINIFVGNYKFDPLNNKFSKETKKFFFIESWEGYIVGSVNPFVVLNQSISKKSA